MAPENGDSLSYLSQCFFSFNFAPDPLTEGPLRAYQMLILGTNLDVVGVLGPRFHG